MMKNNSQERWVTLLRLVASAAVLFLWGLSVKWSAAGLQAKNPEDSSTLIIGYGLAIFVSVAQLIFNRGAINPTLFVVGICAYIYGIATNLVGIYQIFNFDISLGALQTNPLGWIIDVCVSFGLGFTIEVAPEAYLMWALNPRLQRPGDAISTFLARKDVFNTKSTQSVPQNRQNFSYPSRSVPTGHSSEQSKIVLSELDERSDTVQNSPELKQAVREYVHKYKAKNGGKTPSYREIVQNTPLTSTSQVSQYLK
jgi:hypothetical protein